MGFFKSRKKRKAEEAAQRREFLATLKYGSNLAEQWKAHQQLEVERREAWKNVESSSIYMEYDALKRKERETEQAVLDAIRRKHNLPLSEHRWDDGMIIVYDSISVHECDESPIGYCATFIPEGSPISGVRPCLFCGEKV